MEKNSTENMSVLLSILSGLMLSASFPPSPFSWMAWFSLVPLLISLKDMNYKQAFRNGFLFGVSHYITLIYWVYIALHRYGYLHPAISASCMILLCFYMALYKGIFSVLYVIIKGARFWPFICASLWVGLEFILGKALSGFPWGLVGYTQYKNLYVIQIADILGVYGISFIIVLVNSVLAGMFIEQLIRRRLIFILEVLITLILLVTFIGYGVYSVSLWREGKEKGMRIKLAIVQGNVDQSIKWNPAYQEETIEKYERLTSTTRDFDPSLIIWPETALPFFFQDKDFFLSKRVKDIAIKEKAWLIFGSPAYRDTKNGAIYYNRAYLLSPQGEIKGYYDKVHLVPFGEYVPLRSLFPFFRRLVEATGEFEPGSSLSPLDMDGVKAGVLICYEAIFPELSQRLVQRGANLLVNLTNDAWFGLSSAPYQHLSMAVLRAVETRRPLIRSANTGISAFVNPDGSIASSSPIFEDRVIQGIVYISDGEQLTPYVKYGHFFPLIMLCFGFIAILANAGRP